MESFASHTTDDGIYFAFAVSFDDLTYLHEDLLEQVLRRLSAVSTTPEYAAAVNSLVQMVDEGRKGRRKLSKAAVYKVLTSVVSKTGETP